MLYQAFVSRVKSEVGIYSFSIQCHCRSALQCDSQVVTLSYRVVLSEERKGRSTFGPGRLDFVSTCGILRDGC